MNEMVLSFSQSQIATRKARTGRGWIWFFVALALLTLAAISVQIWYNPTVPLTAPLLTEARAKWKERGPTNYDMDYMVKKVEATERFQVRVRNGQAISVVMNDNVPLESRHFRYHTMPALYEFIEEFMDQDAQPGRPRTFTNVFFDPTDGHLIHYVRSVVSKRERQEIIVQLTPVPANSTNPP
jgi:hypothetical protein